MAWEVLLGANDFAKVKRQPIVEYVHLVKSLLQQKDGLAPKVLTKTGLHNLSVLQANDESIPKHPKVRHHSSGHEFTSLKHLLLACHSDQRLRSFGDLNLSEKNLREVILAVRATLTHQNPKGNYEEKYGDDSRKLARLPQHFIRRDVGALPMNRKVPHTRNTWRDERCSMTCTFQLIGNQSFSNIGCNGYQRLIHQYTHSSEDLVFESKCLQHPYKNWQEQRKAKLTSSTFGYAIGLWRGRRAQLWLEKLGLVKPFKDHITIAWNNIKEDDALKAYISMTNNRVFHVDFQVHDQESWLAASPDGVIGSDFEGILEIKIPLYNQNTCRPIPWKRIPLYYMPQAQGILEITDRDWMDFFVWTSNRSNLFRVYRDSEYWSLVKTALSDFWWNHVEPAKMILCNDSHRNDTFDQLRLLVPEPRHMLCDHIIHQSEILADKCELLETRVATRSHLLDWGHYQGDSFGLKL